MRSLFTVAAAFALVLPIGTVAGSREGPSIEPVVVNLQGEGLTLTSPEDGVMVNLVVDGTKRQTAWTRAESRDAFLVVDANRNGRIEIPQEFVGGPSGPPNAFAALRAFDGFSSEHELRTGLNRMPDGKLDGSDAYYSHLILWVDANHDALADEEELESLKHAGVVHILTGYEEVDTRISGGLIRYQTQALLSTTKGVEVARSVFTIALKQR